MLIMAYLGFLFAFFFFCIYCLLHLSFCVTTCHGLCPLWPQGTPPPDGLALCSPLPLKLGWLRLLQ